MIFILFAVRPFDNTRIKSGAGTWVRRAGHCAFGAPAATAPAAFRPASRNPD
jgi:hypothetical protein